MPPPPLRPPSPKIQNSSKTQSSPLHSRCKFSPGHNCPPGQDLSNPLAPSPEKILQALPNLAPSGNCRSNRSLTNLAMLLLVAAAHVVVRGGAFFATNLHFLPLGIMIAGAACHAARFWSDGQNLRHQQQSADDLRRKNPPKASFKQKDFLFCFKP
ncbi:hypothetical protein ScalyP_jg11425 [Parmales sp. scaly parma]|nr:hypothetical protein ScalyP_jg11425 [Parmales sp. scaly parma]